MSVTKRRAPMPSLMMYTLDANIFVRDADPRDADHAVCHALLVHLGRSSTIIIEPMIVLAEVAGALSRELRDPMRGRLVIELLVALPNVSYIPVDVALGREAAEIAADYGLRGMDALYVAVARRSGSAFVSLDAEARRRAAVIVSAITPAEALAALTGSS